MHASHVVVDTRDGWTWARDASNQLLTEDTAREWCDRINAGLKPGHQTYEVFTLTPVPADARVWEMAVRVLARPDAYQALRYVLTVRAEVTAWPERATAERGAYDGPACILTGGPGEDPDDCTTHAHEVPAGPAFADMRQPGTEWPGHWRSL